MPNSTSASDRLEPRVAPFILAAGLLLIVSTKLLSHRGQELIGIISIAPGLKAFEERSANHRRRYTLLDCRRERPTPLTGVRHATCVALELGIIAKRVGR